MAGAPEWRFDPLTGRRVLISPDRAERPQRVGVACPFCEGHEGETPPEVLAYRSLGSQPNGPGWRVRVVPNRYAAVRMDVGEPGASATGGGAGPRRAFAPVADAPSSLGLGVAEVFLESPHHETAFRKLSPTQAGDVLRAWRDRLRFWRDDGRLAFAQVFKNEGPAAGASVEHCHSQLIGIPFVPPAVGDELRRAAGEQCPLCERIAGARSGPTFVTESRHFTALCPPAPRFPGETWVLPKQHAGAFETTADGDLDDLVGVLFELLARIDRVFKGPDFNLIVRSAPFRHEANWHWRIELLPRTTTTAGWEWGTGLLINTLFPERAAELLRVAG
jgi:UDPglucose--hexose-1-phosphate uridylyltransferase